MSVWTIWLEHHASILKFLGSSPSLSSNFFLPSKNVSLVKIDMEDALFSSLSSLPNKIPFVPFRHHSQFVAEFDQFLFHRRYECQCGQFG